MPYTHAQALEDIVAREKADFAERWSAYLDSHPEIKEQPSDWRVYNVGLNGIIQLQHKTSGKYTNCPFNRLDELPEALHLPMRYAISTICAKSRVQRWIPSRMSVNTADYAHITGDDRDTSYNTDNFRRWTAYAERKRANHPSYGLADPEDIVADSLQRLIKYYGTPPKNQDVSLHISQTRMHKKYLYTSINPNIGTYKKPPSHEGSQYMQDVLERTVPLLIERSRAYLSPAQHTLLDILIEYLNEQQNQHDPKKTKGYPTYSEIRELRVKKQIAKGLEENETTIKGDIHAIFYGTDINPEGLTQRLIRMATALGRDDEDFALTARYMQYLQTHANRSMGPHR